MIYTDSRYASGNFFAARKQYSDTSHATVLRQFPTDTSGYHIYSWQEGDRIDLIARRFYNDASVWWKIMDYNPEVINPMDIPVGTTLRLPNVV